MAANLGYWPQLVNPEFLKNKGFGPYSSVA